MGEEQSCIHSKQWKYQIIEIKAEIIMITLITRECRLLELIIIQMDNICFMQQVIIGIKALHLMIHSNKSHTFICIKYKKLNAIKIRKNDLDKCFFVSFFSLSSLYLRR